MWAALLSLFKRTAPEQRERIEELILFTVNTANGERPRVRLCCVTVWLLGVNCACVLFAWVILFAPFEIVFVFWLVLFIVDVSDRACRDRQSA